MFLRVITQNFAYLRAYNTQNKDIKAQISIIINILNFTFSIFLILFGVIKVFIYLSFIYLYNS